MAESAPDDESPKIDRWAGLGDIVAERQAEASPEDREYSMEAGVGRGFSGDNSDEERLRPRRSAAEQSLARDKLLGLEEELRRANRRVIGPASGQTGMSQVYGHPVEPGNALTEQTQLLRPVEPPDEQQHP